METKKSPLPLKLLLLAHLPPPHHGQSYMIKRLLEGWGGDHRREGGTTPYAIACYHVDIRLSRGAGDTGRVRPGKVFATLGYIAQALWCRFRYGVKTVYYVPAPGRHAPLYRDWLVLFFCRPFFPHWFFHWHAGGLGHWLEERGQPWERAISRALYRGVDLSVTPSRHGEADARLLAPQRVMTVTHGIPDPCPEFEQTLLSRRVERLAQRRAATPEAPAPLRLLFLAHCSRDKGLFDSLEALALLRQREPRFATTLTVAGSFVDTQEEALFRERIAQPDLTGAVTYAGFVDEPAKRALLEESDLLTFPTFYLAESFGLVVVEAMAFGVLPAVTPWRAIPEIVPDDYPGLTPLHDPAALAQTYARLATWEGAALLRRHFEERFTEGRYFADLAAALHSLSSQR